MLYLSFSETGKPPRISSSTKAGQPMRTRLAREKFTFGQRRRPISSSMLKFPNEWIAWNAMWIRVFKNTPSLVIWTPRLDLLSHEIKLTQITALERERQFDLRSNSPALVLPNLWLVLAITITKVLAFSRGEGNTDLKWCFVYVFPRHKRRQKETWIINWLKWLFGIHLSTEIDRHAMSLS